VIWRGAVIIVRWRPGTNSGGGAPIRWAVPRASDADICGSLVPKTTSLGTAAARSAVNWPGVMAGMPCPAAYSR
jgi:hypothetical protein